VHLAVLLYASPLYWKQDYHTSALTGRAWVNELIVGHPDRIKTELCMKVHVFLALAGGSSVLVRLYPSIYCMCVSMIILNSCRYFRNVLFAIVSLGFYNAYVRLPSVNNPVPEPIRKNPKFFPFLKDAIGSMDGTHINSSPS
ncbi:hypothetical protein C8R45DRAFT_767672, partial [Mycena sanguinolenta]